MENAFLSWQRLARKTSGVIEQPLRGDLFNLEQLERHGELLASQHKTAHQEGSNQLLIRLSENEAILRAYNLGTTTAEKSRRVTPAAEWLLDNFYLIKEQIYLARRHLPKSYNRELPRLVTGPSAGFPRVYDIALELITHVDGRIDVEHLSVFVAAYQKVNELKLGELWAIPIMLRLALIENLRRITKQLSIAREERNLADEWVDRMLALPNKNASDLIIVVSDLAKSNPPLTSAFAAEFIRRIQGENPGLQFARHWLEQRFLDHGSTLEHLVQMETQNQAADQVSIGNSITSLRSLGAMDWKEFIETMSVVEQTLRGDPMGVYGQMDFATRDMYRHSVEKIARHSSWTEKAVAEKAITLAALQGTKSNDRKSHVGYYLIDKGLPELERIAEAKRPLRDGIQKGIRQWPLFFYVGSVVVFTSLIAFWAARENFLANAPQWQFVLFLLLVIVGTSHLAISIVNWLATLFLNARSLPRLDFSSGIPTFDRTLVVVPTMLTSLEGIEHLLENIEIHYLSNRDEHLHFALLTDFKDAPAEIMSEDEALVREVRAGISALNQKYKNDRSNIFYLFHRPRRWNEKEGVWMGFERKRGKLADLNSVLRNGSEKPFSEIIGDVSLLQGVNYVITLDTDTQLPRDAARQLIGTMAHPLNRPQFDDAKGRVCEGYGILQPRVAISLPSASRSWFVKLFATDAGIDPYTRVVSDVYQDVFDEGSFIGKGIYDVDAFEKAVGGKFPENKILSHDLLESCHARSALVSDVELYEDHPSRYNADASRRHRWIRGDWQIASWLLPSVAGTGSGRIRNPLSALSKWKIFDNLRRSLVPITLTILLLVAWLTPTVSYHFWTAFVVGIILLPGLFSTIADLLRKPEQLPVIMHLRVVARALRTQMAQGLFTLIFLPYDAMLSADAILRTNWRLFFSRRKLLEWQTSSEAERNSRSDPFSFYRSMWIAPVVAAGAVIFLLQSQTKTGFATALILTFWFLSPLIAWWMSQPIKTADAELSNDQLNFLRKLTRRTWRFFETFVGPEDNWLPPDNFQEVPNPVIASRTSPTNVGMALLSTLAASDFGYITVGQLTERVSNTFATLDQLEKYRGHFYNWYDTRTLKPLLPHYISSVDSGNLAGNLMTLQPGLNELPNKKVMADAVFLGLRDTLLLIQETFQEALELEGKKQGAPVLKEFSKHIIALQTSLIKIPATPKQKYILLGRLAEDVKAVLSIAECSEQMELIWWLQAFEKSCIEHRNELGLFTPWVTLPEIPEKLSQRAAGKKTDKPNEVQELLGWIENVPILCDVKKFGETLSPLIESILKNFRDLDATEKNWLTELQRCATEASAHAQKRISTLHQLAQKCEEMSQMDFSFLFDRSRELFSIGFNASDHRMDMSFYDLLASEARLTSFVAIAQRQVDQDHWFALGRVITSSGGMPTLISWSGSMFEYLMPLLVMPTFENTLLDQTYRAAIARQIEYGKERNVPWGVSESGYNITDTNLNFQYRAFGVPGLGLKRGLNEDLVIAPYACMMGLMVSPRESCENLQRLSSEGLQGIYGFYEAVDYTTSRIPPGQTSAIVRSFMAHHQGMGFLSLAYLLLDKPMQRRFEANPLFKSAELLLQERVPKAVAPLYPNELESPDRRKSSEEKPESHLRVISTPHTPSPEVHLLSNGRYQVMVTNSGGGYSRWNDLMVTRWREDPTRDCWGNFCYIRDLASDETWSAAYQPTLKTTKLYEAIFSQGRAEFRRRHENLDTHTEIAVSPEDDIELRRVTITNRSRLSRRIELTSYAEVVIAAAAADSAHPAFSNLFVQTEIVPDRHAILCTRRARSRTEKPPFMIHLMLVQGTTEGETSFETDRSKFVGRGNDLTSPHVFQNQSPLSNSQGSVLDPVVSIRRVVTLGPDESVRVKIISGMVETREAALALIEKYQDPHLAARVIELAWTHSQVVLRHLNSTEADAQLYGRLAGALLYASPLRRENPGTLLKNNRGQSSLWGYGISGDLPIALLIITNSATISDWVKKIVQAHAYWRIKGLLADLIILSEEDSVYRQSLHEEIINVISSTTEAHMLDKPGGIFVRRSEHIAAEDRILLQSIARVNLSDKNGTFTEQVERRARPETVIPPLIPVKITQQISGAPPASPSQLLFQNGLGGFTPDGKEYVITLQPGQSTPAPWVNVLANPFFGTVISESGSAYTWGENCHEFRLTPWHNDPISDATGEAFYLRDEQSGKVWSPTPLPVRGETPYKIRHGFGYSVFEHSENGITSELSIFVATDASVKFAVLKVKNQSGRARKLSATGYWEWVLGELRPKNLVHLVTEIDPSTGALLARNPYNIDFAGRVAFVDVQEKTRSLTADRAEFIGRNGTLANPAGLRRVRLSGQVGAGLDPCAVLQVPFELADGQEREIIFRIGLGRDNSDAQVLIQRFRAPGASRQAQEQVWNYWNRTLGAVQVETPDPSVNVLANGWLLYQTLACRLWARTGFYQSGGAFGFRDQIQDCMALIHTEPRLLREQILRAAAHQFREGDVQHWWHPPQDRGVRTHFSDDYLWLPLATCRYVFALGDTGVLDEIVPFLEGRPVKPEEEAYYDLPHRSVESASLYEHCVRSINNGLKFGAHGLPLMGCGDWNDGMNLVGEHGKGESVWLAFFLYEILNQFSEIARARKDHAFAEHCLNHAKQLAANIEKNAWDGEWYRRAYFDNGDPLGSAQNSECQIDSLPQSWAILSGAGARERAVSGMEIVNTRLVRREARLIQLFDPPFDKSAQNPGYIKGYVPGVRENGGQYTHAAVWTIMAFAKMGDHHRAWELFNMINPVNHSHSIENSAIYKVEPYVMAADVYGVAPHIGRGGWTWYTGSAGWMYRLTIESLLGLKLEVDKLHFAPCLPPGWKSYRVHYRYRETIFHITILNSAESSNHPKKVNVDGVDQAVNYLPLVDDRKDHQVEVQL